MTLTAPQQLAASKAIAMLTRESGDKAMALAGYAGTGKTYTVQHICRDLIAAKYRITAITHTRKALGVLGQALPTEVSLMTVFQVLGWRINPRTGAVVGSGQHRFAGADAIIVDECSMIDQRMYDAITQYGRDLDIPILWVGDPAQLPPVGYADSPVFLNVQEQVWMTDIVRQAEGSQIIKLSKYIRDCLESGTRPNITMLESFANDQEVMVAHGGVDTIVDYVKSARLAGLDARAIGFTNSKVMRAGNMTAAAMHERAGQIYDAGDPIIFSSRYKDGVIDNGTTGSVATFAGVESYGVLNLRCAELDILIDGKDDPIKVMAPIDTCKFLSSLKRLRAERDRHAARARSAKTEEERMSAAKARDELGDAVSKCADDYADIRHIYAMTSHKSQGSTFDVAVIDWRDINSNRDVRDMCRMAYVACTRASKYLVIVA